MSIELGQPDVAGLSEALSAMRAWQDDAAPFQLHPGDLGWFCRFGAAATAAAVRTWSRDGRLLAVGLQDESDCLRVAIATHALQDDELARRLAADVADPDRGVLVAGKVSVEVPPGVVLHDVLSEQGWGFDEPWTPLRRDLTDAVPDSGLRIEVTASEPEQVAVRVAAQRGAFDGSTFTEERWHAMAAGPAYADARCLVAFDDQDNAVAAATVWSAGPGRPGLIEPLGADRGHRGHGHGRAIVVACAAALRELGSSSVLVCTPSSNAGGVATYLSAGFQALPERLDRHREG